MSPKTGCFSLRACCCRKCGQDGWHVKEQQNPGRRGKSTVRLFLGGKERYLGDTCSHLCRPPQNLFFHPLCYTKQAGGWFRDQGRNNYMRLKDWLKGGSCPLRVGKYRWSRFGEDQPKDDFGRTLVARGLNVPQEGETSPRLNFQRKVIRQY